MDAPHGSVLGLLSSEGTRYINRANVIHGIEEERRGIRGEDTGVREQLWVWEAEIRGVEVAVDNGCDSSAKESRELSNGRVKVLESDIVLAVVQLSSNNHYVIEAGTLAFLIFIVYLVEGFAFWRETRKKKQKLEPKQIVATISEYESYTREIP